MVKDVPIKRGESDPAAYSRKCARRRHHRRVALFQRVGLLAVLAAGAFCRAAKRE